MVKYGVIISCVFVILGITKTYADQSFIKIACTGPQDAFIVPVVIATDTINLFNADAGKDTVHDLYYSIALNVVTQEVYAYVDSHVLKYGNEADAMALKAAAAVYGSCIIEVANENGRRRTIVFYAKDAILYLEKLVSDLGHEKKIAAENKAAIISKLNSFIDAIKR